MLMDPGATATATPLAGSLIETALGAYHDAATRLGLARRRTVARQGRNFEALKALRALFPLEDAELEARRGRQRRLTERRPQ